MEHQKIPCDICGQPALRTCPNCHKRVCYAHFDVNLGVCTQCRASHKKTCEICSRPAAHKCKLCGRDVCGVHFDPGAGICTMCRISGRREIFKESR